MHVIGLSSVHHAVLDTPTPLDRSSRLQACFSQSSMCLNSWSRSSLCSSRLIVSLSLGPWNSGFCLCLFLPVWCSYLIPLVFYNAPSCTAPLVAIFTHVLLYVGPALVVLRTLFLSCAAASWHHLPSSLSPITCSSGTGTADDLYLCSPMYYLLCVYPPQSLVPSPRSPVIYTITPAPVYCPYSLYSLHY